MKRKRFLIRAFTAALVLALAVWAAAAQTHLKQQNAVVRSLQQQAVSTLAEAMDAMHVTLQKAVCAASPEMLGRLAGELQTQAVCAKTSLASLCAGDATLANLNRFLSQAGAYTDSLCARLGSGEGLTAEERETLSVLLDAAASLKEQTAYMADLTDAGCFVFEEPRAADADVPADTVSYADAAADAEDSLKDFPTLTYDGPYSDNLYTKRSRLLAAASPVSESTARALAAAMLGTEENRLLSDGTAAGRLPAYVFYDSGGAHAAVTVSGGYPAYVLRDYTAGESRIGTAEAERAALDYLAALGYRDMAPTYFTCENGVCLYSFAYTAKGYTCYPDLIKVGVSLSDGTVVRMDARDYLMNHVPRAFPAEAVDAEAAAAAVAPGLEAKAVSRAVIPTAGGYEKFAWEVKCTDQTGRDVLVYIDTVTGQEDDILILLYADGGVLTR